MCSRYGGSKQRNEESAVIAEFKPLAHIQEQLRQHHWTKHQAWHTPQELEQASEGQVSWTTRLAAAWSMVKEAVTEL